MNSIHRFTAAALLIIGATGMAKDLTLRKQRLEKIAKVSPTIAFIKRHPVRPSFIAYTEGQSDAQHEQLRGMLDSPRRGASSEQMWCW